MVHPMCTHFLMCNWMATPFIYIMFKLEMGNKQYEISFEVATSSQTKLQLENFPYAFFLSF